MQLRIPSWLKWLAALTGTALLYSAIEHSAPATWIRETGRPALENLVWSALTSPWAPWAGVALPVVLAAIFASLALSRHSLGRPRTPTEKKADLLLADQCEELAEKFDSDAAWERQPAVLYLSAFALTRLSELEEADLKRRSIRIDSNKGDMNKPEYLEANARCLCEVAAALRKGAYKGKTFRCGRIE